MVIFTFLNEYITMKANKRLHSFFSQWLPLSLTLTLAMPVQAQSQAQAQALSPQADSLAQFVRNIVNYNKLYPREQVYLHFDNTGYFMGETIWFKAYVTNPLGNVATTQSKVLYVELLTPEGRIMQTHKLKIENGQCSGQLPLTDLLHPGYYEVRAYTALMLNWEETPLFSRVFPIFNAPTTEGQEMYANPRMVRQTHSEKLPDYRQKKPKAEKLNIQFFPEGGKMVEEVASNIAFKVTDKQGNPVNANGKIYNSHKEEKAIFTTQHDGMGMFTLTPAEGESYYAEVADAEGRIQRFDLPQAQTKGVVMTINNLRPDQVMIQFARNAKTTETQAMGLTVMSHGQVLLFKQMQWDGQLTAQLRLPKDKMPAGVNQITLFDTQGRIHAERLIFIDLKGKANIECTSLKESYQPREKVEMNFKVTDETGQPLPACFSLAVRDADTDTPINNARTGGIMANLLLGSEVKGYIHNIDYYFESDDRLHRTALDLLLCTQGWRRYDWQEMTRPLEKKVNYPIEESILIRGNLTSTFRKRIKKDVEISVFLYSQTGDNRVGSCYSDSLGNFAFLADDFYGRWFMDITTRQKDKLREMNVNLEKVKGPTPRYYGMDETELFVRKNDGTAISAKPDSIMEYEEEDKQRWENLLPSIKVEAQKEWQKDFIRRWNNVIYSMEDERMRMDETGEQYLVEFYRWLEETNPYFDYDTDTVGGISATYKNRPVRFFITRIGTEGWFIENTRNTGIQLEDLTINDVEAIAISDKPNVEMAMLSKSSVGATMDSITNPNTVVIMVFVRKDYYRNSEKKGHRKTKVQGFTHELQFYMPDYSYTDLPDEKDFRRTLFWEPYVVTNEQGEASVQFYNTPLCRRMKISAETVTGKGRIGVLK